MSDGFQTFALSFIILIFSIFVLLFFLLPCLNYYYNKYQQREVLNQQNGNKTYFIVKHSYFNKFFHSIFVQQLRSINNFSNLLRMTAADSCFYICSLDISQLTLSLTNLTFKLLFFSTKQLFLHKRSQLVTCLRIYLLKESPTQSLVKPTK